MADGVVPTRDAMFDCIQRWATRRGIRGYLTFGDIEQLVTNLEALRYEDSTAEGRDEVAHPNASDLKGSDHD